MPRKQKEIHFIYKTTCEVTSRYYYGMHSTDNLNDGYIGSGTRLWHSINYHGIENHSIEILEYLKDRTSLKAREKELITEEMLNDPMCMNLALGGEGGILNEDHHLKMRKGASNSMKERWKEPDAFAKNRKIHSTKFKNLHKGGNIKYDNFKGKKHSDETKRKMSKSSIGTQIGFKNSQFGTCWIYNETESKKIKKENLESYIKSGWKKGRIINMKHSKIQE